MQITYAEKRTKILSYPSRWNHDDDLIYANFENPYNPYSELQPVERPKL